MTTAHRVDSAAEKETMSRWRLVIQQNPVLFGLGEEDIDQVLKTSSEAKYERGEQIFGKGDVTDALFLIGDGSVEVCPSGSCEPDMASLTLSRPEIFGELGLLEEGRRAVTARAASRCTLLRIGRQEFRSMLENHHYLDIEFRILLQMSERLRYVEENALAGQRAQTDERFRILDDRIKNETKIFDATLKLSQALFDQTKIRTDEVINNAEHSRARMSSSVTMFGSIGAFAVTLFGFLGLKELADMRHTVDEIDTTRKEISEKAASVKSGVAEIESDVQQSKKLTQEASSHVASLRSTRMTLANDLTGEVAQALDERTLSEAAQTYNTLSQISTEPMGAQNTRFLEQVEGKLLTDSGKALRDYTPFLSLIASNTSPDSKEHLRARYLTLANMALLESPPGGRFLNEQTFEGALTPFCKSSPDYKGEPLSDRDRSDLQARFEHETDARKKKFQQVEACLPHGVFVNTGTVR